MVSGRGVAGGIVIKSDGDNHGHTLAGHTSSNLLLVCPASYHHFSKMVVMANASVNGELRDVCQVNGFAVRLLSW